MNAEEYGQLKQSLIDLVPRNSITINVPKKLILRAPNGTFIKFGHMEVDPYMLEEMPQITIDLIHNKLIIQWTDDVDADTYKNIGQEIIGRREWDEPRAEEAIKWIGGLYNIREALGLN